MDKKNLYLFYGPDTYSAWNKSRFWRKEFEKKYGDFNVSIFDGEHLSAADFYEAVNSVPFLGEKKLILVRDFLRDGRDEEQKKVAEKLEDIPDFSFVLFIEQENPDARTTLFKKLKQVGVVEEFEPPVGPQLAAWIQQQVAQKKGTIGPREARLLADTVGPNLWQMNQEIEKLTVYAQEKPISADAIEQLASPNLSTSIFKFTDQLSSKDMKGAVRTLRILLESGEDLIRILFMIVRHFRILIQVRSCVDQKMNRSQIGQKIKEHPYVITTALGQSKHFNLPTLAHIYELLLKIDNDIKGGRIRMTGNDTTELQLALEKFIVRLCQ